MVSPLSLDVQAPVNICVTKDSLHRVCDGAGNTCWSRHIIAIDRATINASDIHMVLLIILATFELIITKMLYGLGAHLRQRSPPVQPGRPPNDQPNAYYRYCLLPADANPEGPYFRGSTCRRSFLASS